MLFLKESTGLTAALVDLAAPWSKLYAHSKAVSAATSFLHIAPLIFGAGAAFVMDRVTLRVSRAGAQERSAHLRELAGTHRVVLTGLALSALSGVLLFLSDVETFLASPLFWIKLVLVGVLLVNGALMVQTERSLARAGVTDALWGRLRLLSMLSAVLWLATTLAGVVLREFA